MYHGWMIKEKPPCIHCGNPIPPYGRKFCGTKCSRHYWVTNNRDRVRHNRMTTPKFLEIKGIVDKLKSSPCSDCGNCYDPYCMDFDHRDQSTKIDSVATMVLSVRDLDRILKEIEKCDLVCSNCHRLRTKRQHELRLFNRFKPRTITEPIAA